MVSLYGVRSELFVAMNGRGRLYGTVGMLTITFIVLQYLFEWFRVAFAIMTDRVLFACHLKLLGVPILTCAVNYVIRHMLVEWYFGIFYGSLYICLPFLIMHSYLIVGSK